MFEGADASPARLAATLLAASTQASQIEKHGAPKNVQENAAYAVMDYQAALSNAEKLGLSPATIQRYRESLSRRPGRPDS